MSTETEMIFRLREERKEAEARALMYAKYADTLFKGLVEIAEYDHDDYNDLEEIYDAFREVLETAQQTLERAEKQFDYSIFKEAVL